jgi:DNA-binding transcriptional LysR family regulator
MLALQHSIYSNSTQRNPRINLKQLRTFLHVAELGKLSLASERLGTAQPALSRQISMLEHELGVRLFDRHGRGMKTTGAGEKLRERASFLIRYLEETRSDIQSSAEKVRGRVVVGMPATLAEVVAAELIEKFVAMHPETSLRIVTGLSGHIHDWLQRGEVDVAVLYSQQADDFLRVEKLFDEELHFVFKPGVLPGKNRSISFAEVCKLPLVLPAQRHGLRGLIEAHATSKGLSLDVQVETDSFRVLVNLASRGTYATILPARSIRGEIDAGLVEIRRIKNPSPSRSLCLALPADRPITSAVRMFSDELKDAVRSQVI